MDLVIFYTKNGLKQNGNMNICWFDLLKIALTPHLSCVLVSIFDLSKFFAFFEVL